MITKDTFGDHAQVRQNPVVVAFDRSGRPGRLPIHNLFIMTVWPIHTFRKDLVSTSTPPANGEFYAMPSKEEKARRQGILQQDAAEQARQQHGDEDIPISVLDLGDLFDFLDLHLTEAGCDHTLSGTRSFLEAQGLSPETIIPWLADNNGYCDCEVLANVEDPWIDEIQSARRIPKSE